MQLLDLPPGHPGWASALPVLQELRTELTAALLEGVLADGAPQGPRFLAAFDEEQCLGVAGWRIVANTNALLMLYIDDLVTTNRARSRGVGAMLLRELESRAIRAGCLSLELDSGVERHSAHRFYERQGMDTVAQHFSKRLTTDTHRA